MNMIFIALLFTNGSFAIPKWVMIALMKQSLEIYLLN